MTANKWELFKFKLVHIQRQHVPIRMKGKDVKIRKTCKAQDIEGLNEKKYVTACIGMWNRESFLRKIQFAQENLSKRSRRGQNILTRSRRSWNLTYNTK